MAVHLARAPAEHKRQAVQQVDAPVGDHRPGDNGDVVLPAKGDAGGDAALFGQMVTQAVGDEKTALKTPATVGYAPRVCRERLWRLARWGQ